MAENIVRTRYRLQPQDLAGQRVQTTITNVTIEGLESLTPVLHFDGIEKPMTLDPGAANDLARITQSAVMQEWIGQTVSIAPVETPDGPKLGLFSATQRTLPQRIFRPRPSVSAHQVRRSLLLTLLMASIFAAVYLFENIENGLAWLQTLMPTRP